jgi:O-antigen ligase
MLKDNWLFGAGLSGYPTALEPYHTHEEIEIFQYPHNLFLNIWSELGLLGLLAAAWLMILSIKKFRQSQKEKSENFWLSAAATTVLLEMFIHGLVDVPFFKNDLAMITVFCLAAVAWSDEKQKEDRPIN